MGISERAAKAGSDLQGAAGNTVQSCPKVTLEIGVFFDGTGNNTANTQSQGKSASYNNARSNVSLLFPLYKSGERFTVKNSCGGAARKFGSIYKEGIGTTAGESDYRPGNLTGAATGMGMTGVESRVFDACLDVGRMINQLSPGVEPTEIILDVFGFSRGAAAARYFVNCMRQGYIDYLAYYVVPKRASLPKGRKIRIRYVGIFDTVAAIGNGKNDKNGDVNVHVATKQADRIHHLTAKHEYRGNFRLNHSLPGGGAHRQMIGAHSDVGGGYRAAGDSALVEKTQVHSYYIKDHVDTAHAAAVREAAAVRSSASSFWASEGWIRPNEAPGEGLVNEPSAVRSRVPQGALGAGQPLYTFTTGARLNRPWVKIGLSRIALRLMYDDAQSASVPFLSFPTSGEYEVPADLRQLAGSYASTGNMPGTPVAREILRNYGHMSSSYDLFESPGMTPNTGWRRGIAPNQPDKAK